MLNLEKKYLQIYYMSAKEDGVHFLAVSVFRHKYEFGLSKEWTGDNYGPYQLYLQRLKANKTKAWVLGIPWT